MMPNAILDDPKIKPREKIVLASLLSHAYGNKRDVFPSQVRLAERIGIKREAVRQSLKMLASIGIIEPVSCDGRGQWKYRLHIDRYVKDATAPSDRSPAMRPDPNPAILPDRNPAINNSKQNTNLNKTLTRKAANCETVDASGSTPVSFGTADCYPGPDRNPAMFTKAEVNALLLAPEGQRVTGDYDDLDYDLNNLILPMLGSRWIPDTVLRKLADLQGVKFCQMWAAWLPRKVAAYRAEGKAVTNPAGLYRSAVENGWQVDPAWPEYDERASQAAADDDIDDACIPF